MVQNSNRNVCLFFLPFIMKNTTLFFTFLLVSCFALAQTKQTSLGFTFSGDYTKVMRSGGSDMDRFMAKILDGRLGMTAGIHASFQRRTNGAFDIGLLYMEHVEGYQNVNLYDYFYNPYFSLSEVRSKNQMIGIPMNWLFFLNPGKTRFYASVGIAPTYCFAGSVSIQLTSIRGDVRSDYRHEVYDFDIANLYLSGNLALGFSHALGEHFDLRMAPTARFLTSSESFKNEMKFFPLFIGLNAGLYYKFNSKSPESHPH